jgi:predicted TIM-barrel fold metal-dependent hydrolase
MNEIITKPLIPEVLRGVRVVDADTHITEWEDLWLSRAPAKYKDRVPQKKVIDGQRMWVMDGNTPIGSDSAISAIRKDGSKSQGFEFQDWGIPDVTPGSYDVKARVRYMDESGIQAQIGYPNLLGFGGQKSNAVDPDLRLTTTRIYNEAMAEMQADSGDRIFPMALLPWWDIKEATAEAKRCAAMGLRGVNINSDPQMHGLPHLGEAHWNPLWEVCVDGDLPVNFHIGASDASMAFGGVGHWFEPRSNQVLAFSSVVLFTSNVRVLTNIFLSGWLERFPTLKIVSVESGVGWLPFMLEAMEYEMLETGVKFSATPHEIFQRQIYGCSWFEKKGIVHDTRRLGVDNVMFETDYPHPTCLYPDPLQFLADTAAEFTPEERVKVFGGNAARVYNLPPAAAAG